MVLYFHKSKEENKPMYLLATVNAAPTPKIATQIKHRHIVNTQSKEKLISTMKKYKANITSTIKKAKLNTVLLNP